MKRHQVQNYLRSFGVLKPQRTSVQFMLEVVVVATVIMGGVWVWRTVDGYAAANRQGPEQQRALAIIGRQASWLHTNVGIAAGEQCFDTSGVPRSGSDPGARCSYFPDGQKPGCLVDTAAYCYRVSIAAVGVADGRYQDTVMVSYDIRVSWNDGSGEKRTIMTYQVLQTDWEADGDNLSSGLHIARSVIVPPPAPKVSNSGLLVINKLSDIPGGAAVSVSAGDCKVVKACSASGVYGLAGSFSLTTNVPDQFIASCTWDFGDGSAARTIPADETGCISGQTVSHSYSAAWQLQNLPPYPTACPAPVGQSLDTHAFGVTVTLHTQEGIDIVTKTSYRLILPGC